MLKMKLAHIMLLLLGKLLFDVIVSFKNIALNSPFALTVNTQLKYAASKLKQKK